MQKEKEIALLREVNAIIIEIGGMDEYALSRAGVNVEELLSPTEETLKQLEAYRDSLRQKDTASLEI